MSRVGLIVVTLLLGGCSQLGTIARVEPAVVARYAPGRCDAKNDIDRGKIRPIDLDCFKFPEANDGVAGKIKIPASATRFVAGQVTSTVVKKGVTTMTVSNAAIALDVPAYDLAVFDLNARNRLASILVSQADEVCERDSASIMANQAATNGILNILTTGLSAAGTIVTGECAKTILAGTAAFVSGSRNDVNAAVYRNQMSQAITAASAGERKRLRDALNARRTESVTSFSVDDMIRAVNEYHQACSFYRGLELALENATKYPPAAAFAARQQAITDLAGLRQELAIAKAQKSVAGMSPSQQKAADDNYQYLLDAIGRARVAIYGTAGAVPPSDPPAP